MKFAFMCREKGGGRRGSIAIVGAGPAGLAASGYLACLGYEVDVYDKLPYPGGLMMFAIPGYRITPDNVIEGVEDLKDRLSVKFVSKTKVFVKGQSRHDEGDDFVEKTLDLENVLERYDGVVVATGTWSSKRLNVEGEDAENVLTALEYLYHWRLFEEGLVKRKPHSAKRVIVIGAGLSAIDAVERALHDGAEVYLAYRRTAAEAPAGLFNIRSIVSQGARFIELVQPTRIVVENKYAKAVEFLKMKLGEPDESGRPRPVPIPGSEFTLDADLVITAVGEAPTPPFTSGFNAIMVDKSGRIVVNKAFQTGLPKVFAAGDVATGPSMIGKAFGSGLRVARFLDEYLLHSKQVLVSTG